MNISLSIVIKTFNRPVSLFNLLRSIQRLQMPYPVLIADDSQQSSKGLVLKTFPNLPISYLELPFDTGLSAGRNILVDHVKTDCFLLCDDDYVFDERTDLPGAYRCLAENQIDILGGSYYNYVNIPNLKVFVRQLTHPRRLLRFFFNRYQTSRYIGRFNITGNRCELLISHNKPQKSPCACDLVNNFFIARTGRVKAFGGWDKDLKMGEHEDFFLRAKQHGLKVAFSNGLGTRHYPFIPVKNSAYNNYRVRAAHFKALFVKKHGFRSYLEKEAESGKILFEYLN
jgi:GT2 family glycosyltransferase